MTDTVDKQLITVAEAARFLGVNRSLMYRYVSEKVLPDGAVVRGKGSELRIKRPVLEVWLAGSAA